MKEMKRVKCLDCPFFSVSIVTLGTKEKTVGLCEVHARKALLNAILAKAVNSQMGKSVAKSASV